MQIAVGGGVASALARGPDGRSVLVSGHGTSRVTLLRPDTPSRPPRAGDPETSFESLYRSVGLRIAAGGPLEEELTLA
jgi:hypothetical protein